MLGVPYDHAGLILYPVAIEVITNKTVWDRIKARCEQIGYCGFDAHECGNAMRTMFRCLNRTIES